MRFTMAHVLNEDIDSMRKYYPNIPEEDFMTYIGLDPTYQGGTQAGKYARWILNLANQSKIPLDDNSAISVKNRIPASLEFFDSVRSRLKIKDIMRFKSLDELDEYTSSDDSYDEETQRQLVRHRQEARRKANLVKDAEIVYEDDDWVVYVPKTYEASCKLGQGTKWCTATTEGDTYFKKYTKDGPLYININKHHPEEKYQLHFESGQYMDRDDDEISLGDLFDQFPNLRKAYEPILQVLCEKSLEPYKEDGKDRVVPLPKEGLANWLGGDMTARVCMGIFNEDPYIIADYAITTSAKASPNFYSAIILKYPELAELVGEAFIAEHPAQASIIEAASDEEKVEYALYHDDTISGAADNAYQFACSVGTAEEYISRIQGAILRNLPEWVSDVDFTGEESNEQYPDDSQLRDKYGNIASSVFKVNVKDYSKAFTSLIQDSTVKSFIEVNGITSVPTAPIFQAMHDTKCYQPRAEWSELYSEAVFIDNFTNYLETIIYDAVNK